MDDESPLNHFFATQQKRKKLVIRRKQEQPMAPRNVVVGRGRGGVDHLFFGVGSQVEVSSDEIGFKGSWYTATIIEIDHNTRPPSSPSPTSSKKKRKMEQGRYLVRYATLLESEEDEDDKETPKKHLREFVEGAFMRPLPPPTESQHAYELNDVVDAYHRDGWWTGVVVGVLDDGSKFQVFFDNPPEHFEFARSELRVHHDWVENKWVRAEKKAHGLLEDCTPKKAAVSAKGLEGQSIKGSGTKNPQRRHGNSSVKSMKNKKKRVNDQHSHNEEIIEPKSGVSSQGRKRGRPKKLMTENPVGLVNGEKNGAESTSYEMVVKENPTDLVNGEEKIGAESTYEMVNGSASNDGEQSTLAGISIQGIPILNHGYPAQFPLRQYNLMDNVLDFRLAKIDNQISETIAGKSGRKPRSCTSKRRNQRSRTNKKSPTQDSRGTCREKPSEQFEDLPQLMWYGSNTQEACIEKASNESKDKPQEMWREGMNSPYSVDDSRAPFDLNVVQSADASDGQDESAVRSPAIATCDNNVSEKDKKSPFEKRSPVWATLERMEIFQKMPQNPHFSPLVKSKEDSREGLAIGQMVIFSSVVEKTSKLQFSDPRSIIDSSLETLSDLETHGFDVHPIRHRLKELLSKKENQGHLLEESQEIEKKIAEQSVEKVKIGEEICEINKKMEELQEKLALATAMEKMTDYDIDTLKSKMDVIHRDIQNAQRDFGRLAAAPW
ncbi:DUF724 domain-containing protein 3-like isoform X3 [Rhododendron vialii]|uniref:DUF724 domain-containing protein 3-like isoform X3 n=1 Tax=Rhododendron vialii TaxID=182163 RepID=UPI00265E6362|nr:DUF724 domain-containing protein 3-like isoform X3 [Rhododendron vialii]